MYGLYFCQVRSEGWFHLHNFTEEEFDSSLAITKMEELKEKANLYAVRLIKDCSYLRLDAEQTLKERRAFNYGARISGGQGGQA